MKRLALVTVVALAAGALASAAVPASASAATGPVSGSTLYAGQQLSGSAFLASPNGRFTLAVYAGEPNLEDQDHFYRSSDFSSVSTWVPTFSTSSGQGSLRMQTDGNFVLYSSAGRALWSSRTNGTGSANRVVVQDDGNLVLYNRAGRALWQTASRAAILTGGQELTPGASILMQPVYPGSKLTQFVMQTDGNLVLYVGGQAAWASMTFVRGSRAAMQTDGNLVVYAPTGRALWDSNTHSPNSHVWLVAMDCQVTMMTEVNLQVTWWKSGSC